MRVGTIGTGAILTMILDAISGTEGISCEAVYSRTFGKGKQLADKYGIGKVYTDLSEMLQDPEINFIYIASPNSLHFLQAKMALEAGKNVICEKPFTSTAKETEVLIELAKANRLFLFEAITTMYLPNYGLLKEKVKSVGDIRLIQCSYCQYSSKYDALRRGETPNVFSLRYSGGAFMDINLYNIYFIFGLFGKPVSAKYYPNCHASGIDTSGILVMQYPGFVCECTGAKDTWGINSVQIQGDKGYIYIPDGSNGCRELQVVTKEEAEVFNFHEGHHQWYFEIKEMAEIVKRGDYENCYGRLDMTREVVRFMETVRKEAGIVFQGENVM